MAIPAALIAALEVHTPIPLREPLHMPPRTPANYPADDPEGTTPPLLINDRFIGDARADQQRDAELDPHGVGDTVSKWHGKKSR